MMFEILFEKFVISNYGFNVKEFIFCEMSYANIK